MVKGETEAPAQGRKPSATATPSTLDKRASPRLHQLDGFAAPRSVQEWFWRRSNDLRTLGGPGAGGLVGRLGVPRPERRHRSSPTPRRMQRFINGFLMDC